MASSSETWLRLSLSFITNWTTLKRVLGSLPAATPLLFGVEVPSIAFWLNWVRKAT